MTSARHYAAEALGTAALLCAVVGSGIMGENLAQGNNAIALLANSAFKLGLVSSLGGRTLARQLVPVLLVPPLLMLLLAAAMFFGQ